MSIIKILLTVVVAITAGCGGGGGDGPVLYGAIALKSPITVIGAAVVTKQTNQANADALALNQCGGGCVIAYRFAASDQCGAAVYGSGKILTWGVGNTSAEAINSATLKCVNGGGTFCTVQTYSCHSG